MTAMLWKPLRVVVFRNKDYPADFPWAWTAGLEEQGTSADGEKATTTLVFADGDTADEAVAALIEEDRRAAKLPVVDVTT